MHQQHDWLVLFGLFYFVYSFFLQGDSEEIIGAFCLEIDKIISTAERKKQCVLGHFQFSIMNVSDLHVYTFC
jgi:hypothetical protein